MDKTVYFKSNKPTLVVPCAQESLERIETNSQMGLRKVKLEKMKVKFYISSGAFDLPDFPKGNWVPTCSFKGKYSHIIKEHELWGIDPSFATSAATFCYLLRACISSLTSLNFSTPSSKSGTLTEAYCED